MVLLSHVLEHLIDPIKVLNKCYDILNKKGIIFIEFPNSPNFKEMNTLNLKDYFYTTHLCNFTNLAIKKMCKKTKFRIKIIRNFQYRIPTIFHENKGKITQNLQKGYFYNKKNIIDTILSIFYIISIYLVKRDTFIEIDSNESWFKKRDLIRLILVK
jgi:2-polyprenyl-3-methyl-5-hydroxy-6-metoxy-1,4-benzoquinol methylase